MHKKEKQFKKNIYEYCNNNPGIKVLFTEFTYLWPMLKKGERREKQIVPKDLAILTSKIVNDLIKQKIIVEIPKEFENFYPLYKILP